MRPDERSPPDPDQRDTPEDRAAPEDRAPPEPWDVHAGPDATLGGYFREHDRPPAFDGVDGEPYTVSLEVEKTADLRASHQGYLVFPRWATTGLGVVGHVETPTLAAGTTREAVLAELGDLPLLRVKELLDDAILRAGAAERESGPADGPP